jgi:hypothetical protein
MPNHGSHSPDGYSTTDTYGTSRSQRKSISEAITLHRSYAGDPATIARCVFRDELRDVLQVLKNCGALHTASERQWCAEELQRILVDLFDGDTA